MGMISACCNTTQLTVTGRGTLNVSRIMNRAIDDYEMTERALKTFE